ncbi:MAG: TolC family protein [Bacteroidia bacterium]
MNNRKYSGNINKFLRISILVICILPLPGWAQVLTIDSVLNRIEKNNPELKMYDAQINAYNAYADGAKSLEPLQVGGGFFMTPYNVSMWKGEGEQSASPGMGSFMISAQQMFSNPKKLNANASYMQSMSSVEKETKNATKNEMFGMAKMNYSELQVMKKKLKILDESEELINYLIQSTEIRYTYGMDKLNSYYKAKAMLGDIQQMILMTNVEIKQALVNLNTLMNRDKDMEFEIDTAIVLKSYEVSMVDTSAISSNRSDYKALEQNINLLKAKQIYEQSKLRPDFGIKYDHMFAFGTQPQQFSLMAMMTIPMVPWSSKMYKSSVAGLNYEIEAVTSQQQAMVNNTSGTLQRLKSQIKNKKEQILLYEKTIIPSLRKNYQVTLLAYEQNTEELFMALDAWQNLKVAQLGYLELLNNLLQFQVQYEKELEIK